jgi:hypothetical protein
MTQTECAGCGKRLATNETFLVADKVLCDVCAAMDRAAPADPAKRTRNCDPTICAGCGADFGSAVLKRLSSGLPVCEPCRHKFLNFPFPQWLKLSVAAMALLTMAGFAQNWRFFHAYGAYFRGMRLVRAGQIEAAAQKFSVVARDIPEASDLATLSDFYNGLSLLQQDKAAEAVQPLRDVVKKDASNQNALELLDLAEYSAAFDRQDWNGFLEKAAAIARRKPGSFDAAASLASAYACKYATSGTPEFRERSLVELDNVKRSVADQTRVADILDRVEHRLATRQILTPSQFAKQYPKGWHKGATLQ